MDRRAQRGRKLKYQCSRCTCVFYCSPECVKINWKTHKPTCEDAQAKREERAEHLKKVASLQLRAPTVKSAKTGAKPANSTSGNANKKPGGKKKKKWPRKKKR